MEVFLISIQEARGSQDQDWRVNLDSLSLRSWWVPALSLTKVSLAVPLPSLLRYLEAVLSELVQIILTHFHHPGYVRRLNF